jgi:hypothetical protein
MRPLTATLALILSIFFASAQIIPVKNSLQTDIAKVISDYPNGFKNISGDQLIENPQSIEFESRVEIKDAKCKVIKYSSTTKEIFSWEAEMLKTDDFDEASKKFRSVYNSLQHLSVNISGINVVFKGEYIKPSESIKFTTIVFNALDKNDKLSNLKISLVLETEVLDWVIKIQVYEKERDDKDRGPAKDK